MKGTILDFLKLASQKQELAQQLVDLAAKHNFEFSDELNDDQLDDVSGGNKVLSVSPDDSIPAGEQFYAGGADSLKKLLSAYNKDLATLRDLSTAESDTSGDVLGTPLRTQL